MTSDKLVGRSSSHFTRVARMFALELGVPHHFEPVFDIAALDPATYAGNPMLKVPIWVDQQGALFGTANICRELTRRAGKAAEVVNLGETPARLVANAEELTVSAMLTGVSILLARGPSGTAPVSPKLFCSIENSLTFLEHNIVGVLGQLPASRRLSFVEVALFCLLRHLPFREIMTLEAWPQLGAFANDFAERESARVTEYRFDKPGL